MAATIRAVAEAAGVSITTVSFVLNNKRPQVDAIPRETRERVKACALEIGYRRNLAAATLRTGRSLWIGVMMQQLKDESDAWMWAPFELSLLSGIQKTLSERGYFAVLGTKATMSDMESIDSLVFSGISGLILRNPPESVAEHIREIGDKRLPTVVVFPEGEDQFPCSIDVDNLRAGQLAAELFARAGRRAPMCVVSEGDRHVDLDRARGFSEVIERELGISPAICSLPEGIEDADRIAYMKDFMRSQKPDCAMVTDAGKTYLVSICAEELNLAVPDEFAIIGFDCYSFRSARDQRVSAVGTSWWQAGQLAASSILDLIENGVQWSSPKRLEPRFMPGDTTPPELAEESDLHWLL